MTGMNTSVNLIATDGTLNILLTDCMLASSLLMQPPLPPPPLLLRLLLPF
jgi:hypothetical protein